MGRILRFLCLSLFSLAKAKEKSIDGYRYNDAYSKNQESFFQNEVKDDFSKRHLETEAYGSAPAEYYGSGYGRQFNTGIGVGGGQADGTQVKVT